MPPRFHLALPLQAGQQLTLPEGPSRHAQVLRLQPGSAITLFNGEGGSWQAEVLQMGRKDVQVRLLAHLPGDAPELRRRVLLAVGMPANERMDHLVEKATELGVAAIQPLMCERSVLRLSGERALRKQAHWQAVAVAACEQSARTRVPSVATPMPLLSWLKSVNEAGAEPASRRVVLTTAEAPPLAGHDFEQGLERLTALSGPEGGLTEAEEAAARSAGFVSLSLGRRVLRADTAPLAALAWWSLQETASGLPSA